MLLKISCFKGYGPDFYATLFEIDFAKKNSLNLIDKISVECIINCSKPESFWFKGLKVNLHILFFIAIFEKYKKPPLPQGNIADLLLVLMVHTILKYSFGVL